MAPIPCPRCFAEVRVRRIEQDITCRTCQFVIPLIYQQNYARMSPVFIQLMGLTGVGKTAFLDMLRITLYGMDKVWPGFFLQPITQIDFEHRPTLILYRQNGQLDGATNMRERNQNEAFIMGANNMPRWGSHFLVMMDHAGEQFRPLKINTIDVPFLKHVPVTIFLLSLDDLMYMGKSVDDLLNSYITTMNSIGVNFRKERREIIFVINKADRIPHLLPELRDYLLHDNIYQKTRNPRINDPMGEEENKIYLQWMEYIDGLTRAWISQNVLGGPALLNMLLTYNINAHFTIMSATGHDINVGGAILAPLPRRVLDPFFWVMEYYKHNYRW